MRGCLVTAGRRETTGPAAELRRAFDSAFAAPPRTMVMDLERLLRIRAGGVAYAVRLHEIAALYSSGRVVPMPGPLPELLGLTTLRGVIVPVYGLGALLGHAAPGGDSSRWVVVTSADEVALGFEELGGYLQLPRSELSSVSGAQTGQHCLETVHLGSDSFSILSVPSIMKALRERVAGAQGTKER